MKFMGSKARIAKEILPIILKDRKNNQWYVEPFAGGMNTICEVNSYRLANDNNKYLIAMWEGLVSGKTGATHISRELYNKVRAEFNNGTNIEFDDFWIGWVGYMASANGRFFEGGYSGLTKTKIGTERDYISESIRNIKNQLDKMNGVTFENKDYRELELPDESIIYCDIPYKNTKQYSTSKGFNHDEFWQWVRNRNNDGHAIFVSEYQAPEDFECVWSKSVNSSLSANAVCGGNKISTEKLFTIRF